MRPSPRPLLISVLVISVLTTTFLVTGTRATTIEHAQQASQQAYSELKAASDAGADITALAARFNAALELLEGAKDFENQGDVTEASKLSSEAEEELQGLIAEAHQLRQAAVSARQMESFIRILSVPVEALTLALTAVLIMEIRRRVQSRQLEELKIKVKATEEY